MTSIDSRADQTPGAPDQVERPDEFPALLNSFRANIGISRNRLAHDVGVDPSYLTRIEHGDREPPRLHILEALARRLRLEPDAVDRFYISAGYTPPSLQNIGWNETLAVVAATLNLLKGDDRAQYEFVINAISERFLTNPNPIVNRPTKRSF